jgi:lysophospholipase L1-like esterase
MIDCLILGDSIAVGLHRQMPQCESLSKGGWNSSQWNRDYLKNDLTAKTVIISLGSNDYKGIKTKAELSSLREKINGRVFWILPAIKPHVQADVREIAALYGDTVVPITHVSDGVHPSQEGYKQIAIKVKGEK